MDPAPPASLLPQLFPRLLLLCSVALQVLGSDPMPVHRNTESSYRHTKSYKFVSVSVACTKSTLMIVASIDAPFFGLVYARGFPLSCRSTSDGQRRVKLKVNVEDCGVKVVEDEDERTSYEMMVYIQYDRHVQQAIDEQVLVRCSPDEKIVVKTSMGQPRTDPQPMGPKPPAPRVKTPRFADYAMPDDPGMTSQGRQFVDALPIFIEEERLQVGAQQPEQRREAAAHCWLDILKGAGVDGRPFFEHLDVGDSTTMLIKTRLNADTDAAIMDVMVTNCSAHNGNMARSQQLIDNDGCTIDPDIMSPVRERPQHTPGRRLHYSTFKAFKFPERASLHLRCTVVVCRGRCPRGFCRGQRHRREASIGLGSIRPISEAELRAAGSFPIDRLLETLQMEIKDGSTIVDRIEVFNSAEVRAPGIEGCRYGSIHRSPQAEWTAPPHTTRSSRTTACSV